MSLMVRTYRPLIGESVWMARPGHTVFTAMPSRTAQCPRAPRPLTPDKFECISRLEERLVYKS
jgi:hypothetical protein